MNDFVQYTISDLKEWAKKPYNTDGDLFVWFLSIGALICATYLWTRTIKRLAD